MRVEEFAPYSESQTNVIQSSDGQHFNCTQWSDIIHLHEAESIANYLHDYYADTPAITRHRFGQGISFYLGTMLNEEGLSWLLKHACTEANVRMSPAKSIGVELIQRSDDTHTWLFALNYSLQPVVIALDRSGRDLITGKTVDQSIVLGPGDVAIIQSALS
jgi:beta-galactosidase